MTELRRIKLSIECWLSNGIGANQRILLLRVGDREGKHPAFLQPVTGGIEHGESPEVACIREVREETGFLLTAETLRRIPETFDVVIDDSLTVRKALFFAEIPSDNVRINPNEHVGWEFFEPEQVEAQLYWQSNRDTWAIVKKDLLPR